MAAAAALATPALYPAFFFVLEKAAKSAGNAVIPTYPMHRSYGLQHLRHKRPTFAFTSESGHTLAFANRIAHKGSHAETGAFPRSQQGFALPVKSLLIRHAFIYIHFPVLCEPPLSATALSQTTSRRVFQLRSQTAYVCFHVRKRVHARLCSKNRTQRLTRRNVCALEVAILEVSCYTDVHQKPLKSFFKFFEN